MKYICGTCRFVYDESEGFEDEGIPPQTSFYSLGEYFCCPFCGSEKEHFTEIKEEIIHFEAKENLNALESIHFPTYKIKNGIIELTPGIESHPMDEDHYIKSMAIYDEYGDKVCEESYKWEDEAFLKFDISDLDEFEIRINCNQHGIWSTGLIENCEEKA